MAVKDSGIPGIWRQKKSALTCWNAKREIGIMMSQEEIHMANKYINTCSTVPVCTQATELFSTFRPPPWRGCGEVGTVQGCISDRPFAAHLSCRR